MTRGTLTHIRTVKIIGAGSIGNHLAHAARTLGCEVLVTDVSRDALERMRTEIYPQRYGQWDAGIELRHVDDAPAGGFDLICIGTPPEFHIPLARQALRERPAALQIEKPLCGPGLEQAAVFVDEAIGSGTRVFIGYDHVVGQAARRFEGLLKEGAIGEVKTADVEFREYWGGIFKAHPWLNGPADSYLGYWERGGGASGEHSHAIHFWLWIAHVLGAGRVEEVGALVRYVRDGLAQYDDCCFIHLRTEGGFIGRVVQDVITHPVKKEAHVQGDRGVLRWISGYEGRGDAVVLSRGSGLPEVFEFPKKRPDDFIQELRHIDSCLGSTPFQTPLSLERGLEAMLVVAAAHRSEQTGRRIRLDFTRGFEPAALSEQPVGRYE